MPRFAANLSWLYTELPFLQRFEAAARDGFAGVEFAFAYDQPPQAVAEQLRAHGLQAVLINAPPGSAAEALRGDVQAAQQRGTACHPARQQDFRDATDLALERAVAWSCPRMHVMAGLLPPDVAPQAARAQYVANLRWAAERAAAQGVELVIEPINPRDVPGYFLQRQADAHAIVAEVGAPNCKVQMDLYHCQIVEGDVAMKLRQYLPTGRVGHLQIAGVPARTEPDVGELHHPFLFDEIDALGYTGWIGCEYRPALGAVKGGTTRGLGWMRR